MNKKLTRRFYVIGSIEMILTKDNMILAKYASKWVLNIHEHTPVIDKIFINCTLDLIGENETIMDDIVESIIMNKIGENYPNDMRFYENWCNIASYSKQSSIQYLLYLIKKYPDTSSTIESIIVKVLADNIKSIQIDIKRHSIFKSLYIANELSEIEYEYTLLLYTMANYPKIEAFIKQHTTIMKDKRQFTVILGIDESVAQNATISLMKLGLMSYKGGRLKISKNLR